jgi:hypothetical protein
VMWHFYIMSRCMQSLKKSKFLTFLELCSMLLLLRVSEIRPYIWLNLLMNQAIKLFKMLHFPKEIPWRLSHANSICEQ